MKKKGDAMNVCHLRVSTVRTKLQEQQQDLILSHDGCSVYSCIVCGPVTCLLSQSTLTLLVMTTSEEYLLYCVS